MENLKVFVGGLAQHSTKESLNAYFSQFGQADSFVMMDKGTGRSRGFGFVNFSDEAVVQAVLQVQHEVDGVRITVSPYSQSAAGASRNAAMAMGGGGGLGRSGSTTNSLKIFVGGLSQNTTRESLNAYFGQFGFADSYVMKDGATGRSRGFGFVNFQDEAVVQAILQTQHEIDGVVVTTSAYAGRDNGRPGAAGYGGGGAGYGGVADTGLGLGAALGATALSGLLQTLTNPALSQLLQQPGIADLLNKVQAQAAQIMGGGAAAAPAQLALTAPRPVGSSGCKIFVGGLAQHTTKESLNAYFSQFGPADSIVMMDKATGRSRGFGFVDFQDEATLNQVMQYSHQIDGVIITCSAYAGGSGGGASRATDFSGAGAGAAGAGLGFNLGAGLLGGVPDLASSLAALAQLGGGGTPALTDLQATGGGEDLAANGDWNFGGGPSLTGLPRKLFVGGLGQETTQQSLREAFEKYGACDCEVVIDKATGRSRGFGFVQYGSETDQQNALASQHMVDGRPVEVSEDWGKGSGGVAGGGKGGGRGKGRFNPY